MKNLLSLFAFLILVLTIGCSNDKNVSKPATQNPVDVYVAGQKNGHACYWKNNQEILLDDTGYPTSEADTIAVANNNVHILGGNPHNYILYWKNGVLSNLNQTLSTPTEPVSWIFGMDVVGDDVYFVGYTHNTTSSLESLVYWENGQKNIVQSNVSYNGYEHNVKIKVFNNNVYIKGFNEIGGVLKSGYYINGVFTQAPTDVWLKDFAIKNNEIYVYGNNYSSNIGYYKNITTGFEIATPIMINKLIFDGNDIYYSSENKIYKNGNPIYSTTLDGINDFAVLNGNTFNLGYDYNGNSAIDLNNTNVLQLNNNGFFKSLYIVQN